MNRARPAQEPAEDNSWVVLNGKRRPMPPTGLLSDVLGTIGVTAETPAIAVAVNGRIVPRSVWGGARIASGDAVEVVRPMQGG